MPVTFYATPEIGSTFLTDVRPVDLRGTVRVLNFAADSDVNNEAGGNPDAYHTPDVPALQRLADKALAQGNYIAWSAENGGAAAPGVRYALAGDGVSNSGSWLFDQPGALTRIAFHAGVLDVIRARQPLLKIGLQFGVPANATPAAAASNGTAYSDLLDAEAAAGLPAKVDYLIVTAFAGTSDQSAWRAQVDFDAATIASRYPGRQVMLMVNHTIGADNGSNYSSSFWRYQLDTAAALGWDVLLYNLGGPRAAEAWSVVRGYPAGSSIVADYELLIYQRLKAILQAHAPLATLVKAGNFIWYDGRQDDPDDDKQKGDPASYPKLALEPSGRTEQHWETNPRYGDHNVNATAAGLARNKVIVFTYLIRITHRNLRLTMNSPVEAAAMTALRNSTPTMGVPGGDAGYAWVRGWGPLNVTRQMGAVEGDTTSAQRMQSVIPVNVSTVFNSADLPA